LERTPFLTGEYRHALDDRGRIAVPARFRLRLAEGATLTRWLDECLAVFPRDAWAELAEKLRSLPLTSTQAREFARFMASGAVEVELDRQGRLLVPGYLRTYAALQPGEVIIVGVLNRLELWAPSAWEPYRSRIEDAPEALAEQLQDLGI
jgi:transcriptional regulator MraZ